ncbi:hypothetical protein [Pseudophaeobacter sp.]|uniref:hypothetical protein n=1 Tax=Pseudophaeobacter sp. TaxID=1971739 RepID=UPI003299467E
MLFEKVASRMFIEHTHLHFQSVPLDRGEFLLLKMIIELGQAGGGLRFENGLSPKMNALVSDHSGCWEALRAGAKVGMQEAGVENAVACLIGAKFQDGSLTLPLCEQLSKTCITRAIAEPDVCFTETGNRRQIQRFKERNADLLAAWDANQFY